MLLFYTNPVGDGAGAPPLTQFRPKVFFFFKLQDNPKKQKPKKNSLNCYEMVKITGVVHLKLIIIMLKVYV